MKTSFIILLWLSLSISVQGGEYGMSERATSLMTNLNIKPLDDNVPHETYTNGALISANIKDVHELIVQRKTTPIKMNDQYVDDFVLSDNNGTSIYNIKLIYHSSAQDAQRALFEHLSMNTLPVNLLLGRYKLEENGPGDICIIDNYKPLVHFVRGNVSATVVSYQLDSEGLIIARKIDARLIASQ